MSKQFISASQAAKKLGVDPRTVSRWVKAGVLPGKVKKVVQPQVMVEAAAVKKAGLVMCDWCGKKFRAKMPTRARFCSEDHANQWYCRARKQVRTDRRQ